MSSKTGSAIGVFDSGIGGLTVFDAIRKHMPAESIIYLGDTARVPYGTKSAETIVRYARECSSFLIRKGVKAIAVACNTASSYALPKLALELNVPVIGVVEPGAKTAVTISDSGVIGVIGTPATVASDSYGTAIRRIKPNANVISRACPLFVPLVEEGWTDGDITRMVVSRYLDGMKTKDMDALVLGCTHYPLIKGVIAEEFGDGVRLVDSAETTAISLKSMLAKYNLLKDEGTSDGVKHRIYVTDMPEGFKSVANRFLSDGIPDVIHVEF